MRVTLKHNGLNRILATIALLPVAMAVPASGADSMYSSFESSVLFPFRSQECCGNKAVVVDWGDQAREGSKVLKVQWWEDFYQDNRASRGTEISSEDFVEIKEEGWYGFSFWINSSGDNTFNLNTSTGIAQALAHGPDPCPVSWTWILNTTPDGLVLSHRYGMGAWTETVISDTIPTDRWVDMVFHMQYSGDYTGEIEVWFDEDCKGIKGPPTYAQYNIKLGLDCWEGDSLVTGTKLKFGMYAHTVAEYIPGEKRVIYFDAVSIVDGNPYDAWYTVNPEKGWKPTYPDPPEDLSGIPEHGKVRLDWSDNREPDLAGYNVYRSDVSGGPGIKLNDSIISESHYSDEQVVTGVKNHYTVRAVNTNGEESHESKEISILHDTGLWRNLDVGMVALPGHVSGLGESITLNASGSGLDNDADAFHFLFMPAGGDCQITARLDSQFNGDAGVMIRESLDTGSRYAFLGLNSKGDLAPQWRLAKDAATSVGNAFGSVPGWLRLSRSGDTFIAYFSESGESWTQVNTIPVPMAEDVFVGLAVSSGNNGSLSSATFQGVHIVGGQTDPSVSVIHLQAESFDSSSQVLIEDCSEGGQRVSFTKPGTWTKYEGTDFGTGAWQFRARVSNPGPETKFDIRLGRTTGRLVGSITVPHTGGESDWKTVTSVTEGITGSQNLYFVLASAEESSVAVNGWEIIIPNDPYSLIEAWRLEEFGAIENIGNGADDSDPDGDYCANLLEYATGSNPHVPQAEPILIAGTNNDGTKVTVSFNRIADPALTYSVVAGEDLASGSWPALWTSVGSEPSEGMITVTDTEVLNNMSQRFLKLKVLTD